MKRIFIGLGIFLGVLLLLVALAPAILSSGPVRRAVVKRVNASGSGTLAIERWSLGWWRGVEVKGLRYDDGQQRFGISAPSVTMSSGLLRLLMPVKNLGTITLDAPRVWCQVDRMEPKPVAKPTGKAPPAKPKAKKPAGTKVPLALDVAAKLALRDGQLEVRKTGQPNTVLALEADVDCPSLKQPIQFKLGGRTAVGGPPAVTGAPELQMDGEVQLLKDGVFDPAAIVGDLALQAKQFDLASLALAKVYVPAMPEMAGLLNANLTAKVNEFNAVTLSGDAVILGLNLQGGVLAKDSLRANSVQLDLDIGSEGKELLIRGMTLQSPFVTVKANGQFTTVAGAKYPSGQMAVVGDVNLAVLAAQLPNTLKLKPDAHVTSGQIHIDGKLETTMDVAHLQSKVAIRDFKGAQGDLAFQQSAPIEISLTGAMTAQGPIVEAFDLQSGFATASGSGSATSAVFNVKANLDAAAKEVGQVVDLGKLQPAGQLALAFDMQSPSPTARKFKLDASLDNLKLAGLTPGPIQADRIHVVSDGVLQLNEAKQPSGLRGFEVVAEGLPLAFSAQVGSLDFPDSKAGTPLQVGSADVAISGTMEALLAFCREAGLVTNDLPIQGPIGLSAKISGGQDHVQLEVFQLTSTPLSLTATGKLDDLSGDKNLDLKGTLTSDCGELAMLAEAFSGYRPDMSGKATRDFALRTALGAGDWQAILRRTDAQAGFHADRLHTLGITATGIDLGLLVRESRAQLSLNTIVNEGQLRAEPYLDLTQEPTTLVVPDNSQLLSGVKLNEEMAAELLARIHPVFRGCAVVGGTVGLKMDHLRAPLGPRLQQDTTFAGTLSLTNVVLRPAGMLGQLLALLKVSTDETQLPPQDIRFECKDGRITPSPLIITADGNKLIFSGWVGLDQTMQFEAAVPLTEELVGQQAYPYVRGVVAKVPITGTVSHPQLDSQGLTKAAKDVLTRAGVNAVIEEVKKGRLGEQGKKTLGDLFKNPQQQSQ